MISCAGDVHVLSAFQQLDANTDHRLALNEIAVLASLLQRIDRDQNGLLSQTELFSDEADADWVKHQMVRIQDDSQLLEPELELEPEPELEPESVSRAEFGDQHDGNSAENAASLAPESETVEEDDAAFIDGLSELTMMMDKASSLGSLLNQHTSGDDVGSTRDRHGSSTDAQETRADGVHSYGNKDGGSQAPIGSRRWQQEDEQAKLGVELDSPLEAEEELRRMRALR